MTSICIVDDDKTDRFIIERALKSVSSDWDITQAGDEHSAFELITKTLPEIVVMDVNLIGSCGFTLAKRLKTVLKNHNITFVMMSGFVQAKSSHYAMPIEIKDVIVKPMRISDYSAFVDQILEAHKTRSLEFLSKEAIIQKEIVAA